MATQAHSLSYSGCNFLRQRLVLSTLSGRPVKIRKIRARDDNPGLRGNSGARSSQGGRRARGETALLPWGPVGSEPPGSVGAWGARGASPPHQNAPEVVGRRGRAPRTELWCARRSASPRRW